MYNVFKMGEILFIIVPIIIIVTLVFMLIMMFSTKARGKMMSREIKATKYMTKYAKEDIEDIMTDMGSASVNAKYNIINENEDILKDMTHRQAEINKESIKTTASAIKEGLRDTMYCKHCGALIDADSKFCKSCGKEQ